MSDLARLFAADPLKLTRTDIEKLVAELRASRHKFNSGDSQAGKTSAPKTKKLTKAQETAKALGVGKIEI